MINTKEQEVNVNCINKLPNVKSLVFYPINKNESVLRGYSK